MYIRENTLDDLLNAVFDELLKRNCDIQVTKGMICEIFGAFLVLNDPRARLSRTEIKGKPFSALGEFFWYMAKSDDFSYIEPYINKYSRETEKTGKIASAYGPRLFSLNNQINQVKNVIELLKYKPTSRRAVIQLIEASDLTKNHKSVPCTTTLQFAIRENKLLMITTMRSNDAYIGLPHDIFCFTLLQEVIARTLNVELGYYCHSVGSLHLYSDQIEFAKNYLKEGFQPTKNISMPKMPYNQDPWKSINILISLEQKIRKGIEFEMPEIDSYWKDFALLIQIHFAFKDKKIDKIIKFREKITNKLYCQYIDAKIKKLNE